MVEDAYSSFEYYKKVKSDLISNIRHQIPVYRNIDPRCPKVTTFEIFDEDCKELSADFINSDWEELNKSFE